MKKLYIDVPAIINSGVPADDIHCEYLFHNENNGPLNLLEVAQFAVYCRQCKEAFCAAACPRDAIEHQENGTIKKYNMRCVGCKSCTLACPFGTIFPEVMNYVTSKCDYCLNQMEQYQSYLPACAITSPSGSISVKEITKEEPEKNIFFIGEHLAVKSPSWRRKEGRI